MTQPLADRFMAAVRTERATDRRSLLGKSALLGGGTAALALAGLPILRASAQDDGLTADPYFEDDGIAILNYALTLEHLEATFYREALAEFSADDLGGDSTYALLTRIGEHEAAHVDALTATITDLGGEPVEEAEYDFGYTDAASFLATAAAIENVGVAAYAGAAPSVAVLAPSLVPTALGIHSVEARHASYVAALINDADNNPFPDAVDAPLTPDEVLEIAGPFIVSGAAATPAATPAADTDEGAASVEMYDFGFEPAELTIAVGTTVTWTNTGQAPHNAAADDGSFTTEFVGNGQSVSYTFDEAGTFPYVCNLHAGLMQAVITVTE